MDIPLAPLPGNRAAIAGARAKQVVVVACLLAGVASQWPPARPLQAAHAPMQASAPRHGAKMARVALRTGGSDAPAVSELGYETDARHACGELSGIDRARAEARFSDGIRISLCGPDLHD